MRGRKPKALSEKLDAGNPGKRSLTPIVPPAPAGDMPCPDTVEQDARAKGYWDHYVATAPVGLLRPVHGPQLADLCIAHSIYDDALDRMRRFGGVVLVAPETGAPYQSPFLAIVNRQAELKRRLCASLCLSPAEQNRVAPPGKSTIDDEWS